jgi:two-component system, LytTR family, response regulator
MKYKVLILEDEKHAQETLAGYLKEHSDFELMGIANGIDEVQHLVDTLSPDLLFSDVMLPPHTSFDWLQTLTHFPFEIIFTTSFEEFAIKAFRLAAVDYLLKPIDKSEFEIALDKFRQKKKSGEESENILQLINNIKEKTNLTKIALPTMTGFLFVAIKDIVRCESDNTYTTFYMSDKSKIVVSKTLKDCEQMLQDYRFFRVHNSHLINLEYITEYIKGEGGLVKMVDGSHVDVSRRRKDEFLKIIR